MRGERGSLRNGGGDLDGGYPYIGVGGWIEFGGYLLDGGCLVYYATADPNMGIKLLLASISLLI